MDVVEARDFNKARGFIIGWSVLTFCLWFFGADLTKFKLMGNEVTLTKNADEAWLLIGIAAIYLWLRCYQHLPEHALKFDEDMNDVYDQMLRLWPWVRLKVYDFKSINKWREEVELSPLIKITRIKCEMNRVSLQVAAKPIPPWLQSSADRTKMSVTYYYYAGRDKVVTEEGWGFPREFNAPLLVGLILKVVAFLVGAFTKSWFTDYVAPLIFGMAAALLALHQWWVVASPAAS